MCAAPWEGQSRGKNGTGPALAPHPRLTRESLCPPDTFQDLVKAGVFEAGFPLHKVRGGPAGRGPEGRARGRKRSLPVTCAQGEEDLKRKWAQWTNMFQEQPIDDIR